MLGRARPSAAPSGLRSFADVCVSGSWHAMPHRGCGSALLLAAVLARSAPAAEAGNSPVQCREGWAYQAFGDRTSFADAQSSCEDW